jgi:hypothetical protein
MKDKLSFLLDLRISLFWWVPDQEEELQQQVQELGTKTGPGVQIIDGT